MAFAWTDEVLALMRQRWCVEGASASQIGAELGTTRNAVSGKIDRLGWRQSSELPRQPRRERGRKPRVRVRKIERYMEIARMLGCDESEEELKGLLTIIDLCQGQCRWPLGALRDPPVHFCGAPQVNGKAYCTEHCERAFVPLEKRKRTILPGFGIVSLEATE